MHEAFGHVAKMCPIEECDRNFKGFPRGWNLADHLRRVHKCVPPNGSRKNSKKSKKRKNEAPESGSSKRSPVTITSPMENSSSDVSKLHRDLQELERKAKEMQNLDPTFLSKLQELQDHISKSG
jgi:predicted RNase H-like nuclease (RuvC/YqgF family)